MNTSRRQAGKTLTAVALGVAALGFSSLASAADTIKVGVLHSLSGTMAISETVLKDTALMAMELRTTRRKLLESAAGFYDKIQAQGGDRVESLQSQIKTIDSLCFLVEELGQWDRAVGLEEQQAALLRQLIAAEPDQVEYITNGFAAPLKMNRTH